MVRIRFRVWVRVKVRVMVRVRAMVRIRFRVKVRNRAIGVTVISLFSYIVTTGLNWVKESLDSHNRLTVETTLTLGRCLETSSTLEGLDLWSDVNDLIHLGHL
jgi:hypothetical protein